MGDISSGSVSSMPGSCHSLPDGAMCDQHPDRPAIRRVQGETDSFGCEYHDECEECKSETRKWAAEARKGICEYCKQEATDLSPIRDYDEGMAGPIYNVCGVCRKRVQEAAEEELRDNAPTAWDYDPPDSGMDDFHDDFAITAQTKKSHSQGALRMKRVLVNYKTPVPVKCKACGKPWNAGHACPASARKAMRLIHAR